ncbi:hemerythrin domain-containing protein [Candidatus Nitrospira bockiana]
MATEQSMNAVEMLKKDHEKVNQLFGQYEQAAPGDRSAIVAQLFNELQIHAALEEEIFYPAVRTELDTEDIVDEDIEDDEETAEEEDDTVDDAEDSEDVIAVAYEEHEAVKDLIKALRKMDPAAPAYQERFAELKEAVLDHVSEEEEVILPAAQLKLDLQALGERMQQRRIALASSMAA